MRIAFMGTDRLEKEKIVDELSIYWPTTKIWKEDLTGETIQGLVDSWLVIRHYFYKNFVAASSIYDAWAATRIYLDPWHHHGLFSWAAKRVWYDYLFYVQPSDPNFSQIQMSIERELGIVLTFHHVPFHVLTGSVRDKVDQVKVITEII